MYPAVLEVFENSIILNKTNISKSITIAKANAIFFIPKNTGLQARFNRSWVKNKT